MKSVARSKTLKDDDFAEADLRMVEKGIDPTQKKNAKLRTGYARRCALERERREKREAVGAEHDAADISIASAASISHALDGGDWRKGKRRKTRRIHTRGALLVYARRILSDRLGRAWRRTDERQLRDAVGVNEGMPDWLTLRESVVVEVEAHRFLGPGAVVQPRELAACCVLCGDGSIPRKTYARGVLAGEVIDRIASALVRLRKQWGLYKKSK
jgi:hypothetical protein